MKSKLERKFELLWHTAGGPPMLAEYRFAPPRKWRADYAHTASRTLIEIEGGAWTGGRHTRGAGFEADCEKYLAATLEGWRVIRLSPQLLTLVTVKKIIKMIGEL